jgi:hypothetical protein
MTKPPSPLTQPPAIDWKPGFVSSVDCHRGSKSIYLSISENAFIATLDKTHDTTAITDKTDRTDKTSKTHRFDLKRNASTPDGSFLGF